MALNTFDNFCEPVHGGQAGPLVKIRPIAATDLANAVSGRVVRIDPTTAEFKVGAEATNGSVGKMPLFLFRGVESPSVYNTGTSGGVTYWVPVAGRANNAIAFVASGGFELQTTEFDTTKTYTPNAKLTATTDGKLDLAVTGNWLVGIASVHENKQNYMDDWVTGKPSVGTNAHGKTVLTFWSVYYPAGSP